MNQLRHVKLYDVATIGGRLRCARECAGMRQSELGKRVGVKAKLVSQMELGRAPMPGVKVAGICMSLKVTAGWLLAGDMAGGPPSSAYGVLRSGQTPRQARATSRAKLQQQARAEVHRRNAERQAILTSKALPVHLCPTTEPPQDNHSIEEAAKPS